MTLIVIGGLWLLLVLVGVPIGIAMIFVSVGYFWYMDRGMFLAVQRMVDGLDSFPLLAVPLFILAAAILNSAGITHHLFGFARALVGHVRGGLGHVNVLASLFFSGMSGSALADAGGLGKMEIEAMREAGYDDDFSGAITAASSLIGPLVPPSITMVLYGVIANVSIGQLFLGGIVPGVLCAVALMVMVYVVAGRRNYPRDPRQSLPQITRLFWRSLPALLTPLGHHRRHLLWLFLTDRGGGGDGALRHLDRPCLLPRTDVAQAVGCGLRDLGHRRLDRYNRCGCVAL